MLPQTDVDHLEQGEIQIRMDVDQMQQAKRAEDQARWYCSIIIYLRLDQEHDLSWMLSSHLYEARSIVHDGFVCP